jgi:hypothetical protein
LQLRRISAQNPPDTLHFTVNRLKNLNKQIFLSNTDASRAEGA